MDEDFLMAFLRARKFNVKKAFKLLQNYWQFRKDYRYIYDSSDADSVTAVILKPVMGFLMHRDRNGCVVLLFKVGELLFECIYFVVLERLLGCHTFCKWGTSAFFKNT
ncbi:hypothetical protein AVEN_269320-1 [Araneus ventricosus]|uniref:CRAL/TRIO N-terminal domain-containing protein n=1 Tax=Araneus ventricosus TaxID=182803 RepID=A0A4Y2QRP8_ARAVE|nr:hypothetical protein AVEN_269320-1 [Araneus ventricosus]